MTEIILIIGILLSILLIFKIDKYLNTGQLFKVFLLFSFCNWYVLPILTSMLGFYEFYELLIDIPIEKYYIYANFEVWFFYVILLIFYVSTKFRFKKENTITVIDNQKSYKYIIPFFYIFTILYLLYCFIYRLDYLQVNEIENAEGGFFFIFNAIGLYIISFYWIGIINFKENLFLKNRRIIFFVIFLILYIVYNILSGSRIYMIALFWMFYFFKQEQFKKVKNLIVAFSIGIVSLILLPILASLRVGDEAEKITFDKNTFELVVEQLNIKSNGIGYSSILIEQDGVGFASYKPYIGSLLKFLPRGVWPEKPTPTSFNGDISGTPARRVAFLLSGENGTYNVGISPGLVCLWQGYFFVFISIILNVMFLKLLVTLLNIKSIYLNSLGLFLFYFPQLIMTPSYGDNIIQKVLEALLLFILLYISRMIIIKRNKSIIK